MAQELKLEFKGLYTAPNSLSAVPEGALLEAQNVVLDQFNILSSRRGQKQYGTPINVGLGQINKIFNYKSNLIINYSFNDSFNTVNKLAYDPADGYWVDYDGYYTPPSPDYKMRNIELNKNDYFTTNKGVYKIDLITNNPRPAGVIEALNGTGTLSGTSGFLVDDSAVAYRLVWSYVDINDNLIRSAPSNILVVRNATGGDKDVSLTYSIPDTITIEYKYSIYRSLGTLTASDTPNDDLQLVLQDNPTPAQVAAKSFTVLDTTPYALMGEFIYTSALNGEGIANANYEPPLCTDMDVFKDCVFYANCEQKEEQTITLITTGLPRFGLFTDFNVGSTNASTTLTGVIPAGILHVGMLADGVNLAPDSYITRILGPTSVLISKPAIATGIDPVTFRDVISIDNVNYFAGNSNDFANNIFKVETAFTPGDDITFTANNLVDVINNSPTNTSVYAYYTSESNDLPGQILLKSRNFGTPAFEIFSSGGAAFVPPLSHTLPISAITTGSVPRVTTTTTSGLFDGYIIEIKGSNSTPSLDGSWTVNIVNSTQFDIISPSITVTSAGTTGDWIAKNKIVVSNKDVNINRVYVSKPSQPEAVPLLNFFPVGSANYPIDRVIALRDGIFFFKQDGIFRTSGNTLANFSTTLVDNTVTMICPESAVVFNNQIYFMTSQGICAVADSVRIISIPIENLLTILSSERFPNFRNNSFAMSYESDRQYIFYTVSSPSDEFATHAYIFNYITEGFVEWTMDRTAGIVNAFTGNKLFMSKPPIDGYAQMVVERKTYTSSDFADEEFTIQITAINSTTQIEFTSTNPVEAGMTIQQVDRILIADVTGNVITLAEPTQFFTVGDADVFRAIRNRVTWAPISGANPGYLKQFRELTLAFQTAVFSEIDISFSTNFIINPFTFTLPNRSSTFGWGQQPWGEFPWGGTSSGGQTFIRTYVPAKMQRCITLNLSLELKEAFKGFMLQGLSIQFNPMSSEFKS